MQGASPFHDHYRHSRPEARNRVHSHESCFIATNRDTGAANAQKFWFEKLGKALPGYGPNGRRLIGDWDANKNPTKATAKQWANFCRTLKDFPQGGISALEADALTLADFKKLAK